MKGTDFGVLKERLTELAEYFGKPAPTKAALRVWADALNECSIDDVQAVLTDWPKLHRLPPLADEVLKLCRARVSDRIEAEAARNRETAPSLGALLDGLSRSTSAEAQNARREIAGWLSSQRAGRRNPKAWAWRLKAREEAGEEMLPIQRRMWRDALHICETDAEAEDRREREAIVAEAS